MRQLFIARHGETEWNASGRLQGVSDVPLNDRGREQARALAASLRSHGIGSIITSDLARARDTGAIVAEELGLAPPHVIRELRERCIGVFEGLTRDECIARYPEAWAAWHDRTGVPEGAESLSDATARIHAVLASIADEPGDPALVISHGGVMRLWLLDVIGARGVPVLHNGITFVAERSRGVWSARMLSR